ncbi:hypothetical protein N0V86_009311 [Didymella sp. IMI 355093]|nr:hypothetical protein N0V86_009311 [Didymella sp. IMI 355093]
MSAYGSATRQLPKFMAAAHAAPRAGLPACTKRFGRPPTLVNISSSQFTTPNGLPPPYLQVYNPVYYSPTHLFPTYQCLQTPDNFPATQTQQSPLSASPSSSTYATFPWSRSRSPITRKVDWVEFVNNLPWLVNHEILMEDRTCPFCWGEFGMDLIYKEESSDSDSLWESDTRHEYHGWSQFCDDSVVGQIVAPTLNGAMSGLHITNPDPPSAAGGEFDDEDVKPPMLTEEQKSLRRQLRRQLYECDHETETENVGKKHYAVRLSCGHMCLVKMLESGEKVCPKCRKDIVEPKICEK